MLEGGCVTSEQMASWVDVAGWFCLKFSVPRWSPKKGEEKTALSGEASRDPTGSSTLGWLPSWLERKGSFGQTQEEQGSPLDTLVHRRVSPSVAEDSGQHMWLWSL